MRLQRTFSSFPSGWVGVGLLALRMTIGASASVEAVAVIASSQPVANMATAIGAISAVIAGVAAMIGFLTPFACALLCVEGMVVMLLHHPAFSALMLFDSPLAALLFVVTSAALIALGPGAVSVDARRFGRREIAIRGTQRPD